MGQLHKGQLQDGLREGRGITTHANGEVKEGEWHKEKMHGAGIDVYEKGDGYRGHWIYSKMHGHSILEHSEGIVRCYDGEWRDGKKHGKGIFHFTDGRDDMVVVMNDGKLLKCGLRSSARHARRARGMTARGSSRR